MMIVVEEIGEGVRVGLLRGLTSVRAKLLKHHTIRCILIYIRRVLNEMQMKPRESYTQGILYRKSVK